jgi:pyruvate carboxylase
MRLATEQEPDFDGERRTRWMIVRDTYPKLEKTTQRTWRDWFPEEVFGRFRNSVPPTHTIRFRHPSGDGTWVNTEVIFHAIGTPESGVPKQADIRLNGHALQCRITTEDPEQNFIPDYGRITAYRSAAGFGIRLDGGTAYSGAIITRYYDPLLVKVTASGSTPQEAISRMDRALREFRIRGVATNLTFLEAIIGHPSFRDNSYTTRFIDTTPELFQQVKRQDRATKLLTYLADVTVNGHPEVKGRPKPPADAAEPVVPYIDADINPGTKQLLDELGPKKFGDWMRNEKRILMTDTTMRDGHQSLLATRVRTHDIARIADTYARALPNLFSLECWGGATFDVSMRFLTEDPCPSVRVSTIPP